MHAEQHLKQMSDSNRRPNSVQLVSVNNKKLRLPFLVQQWNGRVRNGHNQYESMDLSRLVSTVQAAGDVRRDISLADFVLFGYSSVQSVLNKCIVYRIIIGLLKKLGYLRGTSRIYKLLTTSPS